jgi:hypothetical protein
MKQRETLTFLGFIYFLKKSTLKFITASFKKGILPYFSNSYFKTKIARIDKHDKLSEIKA